MPINILQSIESPGALAFAEIMPVFPSLNLHALTFTEETGLTLLGTMYIPPDGDLSQMELLSSEKLDPGAFFATMAHLCPVDGDDLYLLSYSVAVEETAAGMARTVRISPDGSFVLGNGLEFQATDCWFPRAARVSDSCGALLYCLKELSGTEPFANHLKTTEVDVLSGELEERDHLQLPGPGGIFSSMTHIFGDVYAVVYGGEITTVRIDPEGNILGTVASVSFDEPMVMSSADGLLPVSGKTYALAYMLLVDEVPMACVKTIVIEDDGQISSIGERFVVSEEGGLWIRMAPLAGDLYVLTYTVGIEEEGGPLFASALEISTEGLIDLVDTVEVSGNSCVTPEITRLAENVFLVVYTFLVSEEELWTGMLSAEVQSLPSVHRGLFVQLQGEAQELCLVEAGQGSGEMGGIPKLRKGSQTYDLHLVEASDPDASPVRLGTSTGTKAIRRGT